MVGRPEIVAAGKYRGIRVRLEPERPRRPLLRAGRRWKPLRFDGLGEENLVLPLEDIVDGDDRLTGHLAQRVQQAAHDGEGVLVEAGPDVQAVFLDALAVIRITAAGTFATQPPAELM